MKPNFVLVDKNYKKPLQKKNIDLNQDSIFWKSPIRYRNRKKRENALKKECAERKKLNNPLGKNSKYVWLSIKNTTESC